MQSGPGAGMMGDRKDIAEKTSLKQSDMGGFPVNGLNYIVLDESINNTWTENLKFGGLNAKF